MLSEKAWSHIRQRHPEVSRYEELVRSVAAKPESIFEGSGGERKATRLVKTHLSTKYLVVVYREENSRKAIITAYFTSDLRKIKGELVWKA